jgi:hypothetical protein
MNNGYRFLSAHQNVGEIRVGSSWLGGGLWAKLFFHINEELGTLKGIV